MKMVEESFLKNVWYVAGWADEFEGPGPIGRTIINEPAVFYRKTNGALVAFEDRCAHRWAPLSLGRVEGDHLRCMYHGAKFGPDGRCVEVPGQDRVASSLCVRTYPVIERHGFVWVWIGDAARADPNQIPDLGMLDQPWRRIYRGTLDYQANYALINDNLLDLSHVSFLHEKTLGRPVVASTATAPKPYVPSGSGARSLERGVRVEYWVSGPTARLVTLPPKVPDGDLWSRVDFLVPGILISHWQMHREGTAQKCQGAPPAPTQEALCDGMSIQAVTPMTARSSRYFYSFGPRAADTDQQDSDAIWAVILEAFSEDLRMIEALQRTIDHHPRDRMGAIASDKGLVMFRNLMKKLIAAEASPAEQNYGAG